MQRLEAAIAGRDLAALQAEGFAIGGIPGCDPDKVQLTRRQAARVLAELARQSAQAGAPLAQLRERYAAARKVAPVEPVLRGLADVAYGEKNWAEAARFYNDLLIALQDPQEGDPPVPPTAIAVAYQRAAETQMLAPLSSVLVRVMRDGTPGGLDAALVPGALRDLLAVPRARPLPVTFESDSDEMTVAGVAFAHRWWDAVRAGQQPALVLAGHADLRGSDAYNDRLSLRRAAKLGEVLRARGYDGRLVVAGFGRRCPVQFSAGSAYTLEEQLQILRRVEVVAGNALPEGYCGAAKPVLAP